MRRSGLCHWGKPLGIDLFLSSKAMGSLRKRPWTNLQPPVGWKYVTHEGKVQPGDPQCWYALASSFESVKDFYSSDCSHRLDQLFHLVTKALPIRPCYQWLLSPFLSHRIAAIPDHIWIPLQLSIAFHLPDALYCPLYL